MNKKILYVLPLIILGLGLTVIPVMAQPVLTPYLNNMDVKATGWLSVRYHGSWHSFWATFEFYGDRYGQWFQLNVSKQSWGWMLGGENSVWSTVGLYTLLTGFGSQGEAWAVIYGNLTITPPQNPPNGLWTGYTHPKWVMATGTIFGLTFHYYSSKVLCTENFVYMP